MKTRSPYLLMLVFFLLLMPLAVIAYQGSFTRFHADDFCMAADATHAGLLPMLSNWYISWTGRYSFILGTGILGLGGPSLAAFLPAIVAAAWLLTLAWAAAPLVKLAGSLQVGWHAACASALVLLILFSSTPNLYQSFLWEDGLVNYTLPLVIFSGLSGILVRAWLFPIRQPWLWGISGGLLAVIAGGFTEAYGAMQVIFLGLILAASIGLGSRETRHRMLVVGGAALVGALLAIAVVAVAPGNLVRQAAVGERPGIAVIITFSLRNAAVVAGKFVLKNFGWAAVGMGVSFLTGWLRAVRNPQQPSMHEPRKWWSQAWFQSWVMIPPAAFLLVTAACAPVVFAMNAYPDDRTIFIPQFILVLAVAAWSALSGYGLVQAGWLPDLSKKKRWQALIQMLLLVVVLGGAIASLWHTSTILPGQQTYARKWDERAAILKDARQAGQAEITVAGLDNRFGVPDLQESADYWVNRCMASYYGFSTVRGK